MLGFEFETTAEPFAIFVLVSNLSKFLIFLIQSTFHEKNGYFIYVIIFGIIGLLMNAVTLVFDFKIVDKSKSQGTIRRDTYIVDGAQISRLASKTMGSKHSQKFAPQYSVSVF